MIEGIFFFIIAILYVIAFVAAAAAFPPPTDHTYKIKGGHNHTFQFTERPPPPAILNKDKK